MFSKLNQILKYHNVSIEVFYMIPYALIFVYICIMLIRFIIRIGKINFDLFIIDQYVALNGRAIDDRQRFATK